jgi:hypothetical protein
MDAVESLTEVAERGVGDGDDVASSLDLYGAVAVGDPDELLDISRRLAGRNGNRDDKRAIGTRRRNRRTDGMAAPGTDTR